MQGPKRKQRGTYQVLLSLVGAVTMPIKLSNYATWSTSELVKNFLENSTAKQQCICMYNIYMLYCYTGILKVGTVKFYFLHWKVQILLSCCPPLFRKFVNLFPLTDRIRECGQFLQSSAAVNRLTNFTCFLFFTCLFWFLSSSF